MIVLDMSKKEREMKLREELKMRKENGETGWYVKRGKLEKRNFKKGTMNQKK